MVRTATLVRLCCLLFLVGAPLVSIAQIGEEEQPLSIVDVIIQEGDDFFDKRETVLAAEKYQEALAYDPENFYASYRYARCMWYLGKVDSTLKYLRRAIEINPDGNDMVYFDLGVALKTADQCFNAKQQFEIFKQRRQGMNDPFVTRADFEIMGCDSVISYYSGRPHEWKIDGMDDINTPYDDFNAFNYIVEEDSFLIYTSHREEARGKKKFLSQGEQKFSDLWISPYLSPNKLETPENMGRKINTKANDGSACLDPTGLFLYYTICGKGKYKKKYGCSIYMSEFNLEAKAWGKYQLVSGGVNGKRKVKVNSRGKSKEVPSYDAQPFLSADGQTMYFVSDRHCPPGGPYDTDIYYAQKAGSSWGEAVRLDSVVNTPFDELFPVISEDNTKLYFASDGHPGYGGLDIFVAEGSGDVWNKPMNMGPPINSSFDEKSLVWNIPDSSGFFASNRPNGWGMFDVYEFVSVYRPPVILTVHGTVRDLKTRQVVPFATVVLYEMLPNGGRSPQDTFKTDQTGYYEFTLENNKDYLILGNAPDYYPGEDSVSTKGIEKTTSFERNIDIFLERIELGLPIVLQNVYFDFDHPLREDDPPYRESLRPESIEELDRLIDLMKKNPRLTIQIGSHTDTNGSEEYNISLSDRRSTAVVEYLIDNGIDRERLRAFGYGESQPLIYPELTDQDEQLNRRSEFRVNSTNYSPSASR